MIGLGILISSIVVPFSQSRKHQIIGFALNCAENWLDFSFSKKSEQEELKFIKEKWKAIKQEETNQIAESKGDREIKKKKKREENNGEYPTRTT